MVVTLQPFLLQFSRFLSEYHKKHIKTTFYLNVTESHLQSSGITVKDTLIYYSVMGCVVKLSLL